MNQGPEGDVRSASTALGDQVLSDKLHNALAAHLYREARRLGLPFSGARVATICQSLLREPVEDSSCAELSFPAHAVRESTLFNTYYTENLELHDYLHMVSQDMRKRLGQYVTPSVIVKYILDAVEYREDLDILDKRLTDPACGSGIFLLEAIRIYLAALRRANTAIETWYPRVLSTFLGLDIDPIACLYTRFNLSLLLTPAILFWADGHPNSLLPPLPVYCLDTLGTVAAELNTPSLFSDITSSPRLLESSEFVVGNPPYHKIGQLDPSLRQVFQASLYGHPNAYGLFLHAGVEMLRPGGILGYIIPRSMLSGLYFKNLRHFVEKRACVRELTLLAERKKVFQDVLQGTMVLVVQRRPVAPRPVRTCVARSVADLETRAMPYVQISAEQVVRRINGTSVWLVGDSRRTYDILSKLLGSHPLLSSPAVGCPAKTGPIVWNRVKALLRPNLEDDALPLIWSTDIGRFSFSFASSAATRPPYLKVTERTRRLMNQGLSLLVQRVTADEQPYRLVACIPASFLSNETRGYFVENHLNVIQPRPGAAPIDLYYLLGVICSDVMEFLFRIMNGNTQVSATELNLLPIPRCGQETQIAALTRRLQDVSEPVTRAHLEQQLNQEVAEAYGLSADELLFVQETLAGHRMANGVFRPGKGNR